MDAVWELDTKLNNEGYCDKINGVGQYAKKYLTTRPYSQVPCPVIETPFRVAEQGALHATGIFFRRVLAGVQIQTVCAGKSDLVL